MRKYVWAAVCSGLVAACGGGGNSGQATTQPSVGISGANQDGVGRAAASAAISISSVSGGVTASGGGSGVASLPGVSRQVALALNGTRKAVLGARVQPLAVQQLGSMDCPAGGTAVLSLNDTNNSGDLDIGEALVFTFTNCKWTETDSANGTISVTVASAAQTTGGITFTGVMTLAMTATEGGRMASVSGSVQATYTDVTTTVSRMDLTVVGGSNLTGSVTSGGVTETLTYEQGFSISETDTADRQRPPGVVLDHRVGRAVFL